MLLSENRRKLVNQQVDTRNRLRAVLKDYFPPALEVAGDNLASPLACAFLLRWSDLASLQRAKPETIRRFYYGHCTRRGDVIEKRLEIIKVAKPVSTDPALIEPCVLYMRSLVEQLRAIQQGISKIGQRLQKVYHEHPDYAIWNSFLGSGESLGPRLACAWTSERDRFPTAGDMQVYSGVAPVRQASGKRTSVFRRYHRPLFLHQTFWEYAKCSVMYCQWAKAYIQEQERQGVRKSTAYRSLAFKWQRIMHACWQKGEPYDDERYCTALKNKQSPYQLSKAA